MLITVDTHNYTPEDRSLVAQALGLFETQETTVVQATTAPRKRRTKVEIAADEAAEAAKVAALQGVKEHVESTPDTPEEEDAPAEEPTADSENAESDKAALKVTVEEVVAEATKLIAKDKTKMRAILDKMELRKISDASEDQLPVMLEAVRDTLSKLPATA